MRPRDSGRDELELTETNRHRLLADEQRRALVELLWSRPGRTQTTLAELTADLLRAVEPDTAGDGAAEQALRCRLHHVHLPMLSDAGLLEYDADASSVSFDASQGQAKSVQSR